MQEHTTQSTNLVVVHTAVAEALRRHVGQRAGHEVLARRRTNDWHMTQLASRSEIRQFDAPLSVQ